MPVQCEALQNNTPKTGNKTQSIVVSTLCVLLHVKYNINHKLTQNLTHENKNGTCKDFHIFESISFNSSCPYKTQVLCGQKSETT